MSVRQTISQCFGRALVGAAGLMVAACTGSDSPATLDPTIPSSSVSDKPTPSEASRFLMQSTFGPTEEETNTVVSQGYSRWFKDQMAMSTTPAIPDMLGVAAEFAARNEPLGPSVINDFAWRASVTQRDQLRQRMVYALSQIIVVSREDAAIAENFLSMAHYIDILNNNAFGSYRQLLEDITYSPAMATYLTYLNSQKENPQTGSVPDENYARELMQLFTIGLVELNDDGTARRDGQGNEIETYTNTDITELSKVFTGLSWADNSFGGRTPSVASAAYSPLQIFPDEHSTSSKAFLGVTIPAGTDAATSIDAALDALMRHNNTAPFVCEQLIQRMVTSNPTPAYVQRVVAAFRAGIFILPDRSQIGTGQVGDLSATLAAILFDTEARDLARRSDPTFGAVREPVLRFVHFSRVFGVNQASTLRRPNAEGNFTVLEASSPDRLGQQQYRSPSVFNFFRPGYVAAGTQAAAAGLVAPELQILSTQSVTSFANFMQGRIETTNTNGAWVFDFSREAAIAQDPAALVARLNLLLTANSMTPETQARIVEALNSIPIRTETDAVDRINRVRTAALMTALSTEFTVLR